GLIHDQRLVGQHTLTGLQLAAAHFRGLGYRRFVYKPVPHFYQRVPAQDDLYALFRAGARRVRCDLSSTIDLTHRRAVASRRRRGVAKAHKAGVSLSGQPDLQALWRVLQENLANKHGARPVHTLTEIALLIERFPDNIQVLVAQLEGRVVAGVVLFITPRVWHAQYIASDELGRKACALDLLFEHAIARATEAHARWFDFGISNEQNGQVLNEGLYEFKTEFGGGGTVHEIYELAL
ncbi:MAG TPA: GNAT family N-acetyltransferase, partial [Polyangiales bacterium]|nr:GNAT family N-acetyltransferase [Polyangiales bacterium]